MKASSGNCLNHSGLRPSLAVRGVHFLCIPASAGSVPSCHWPVWSTKNGVPGPGPQVLSRTGLCPCVDAASGLGSRATHARSSRRSCFWASVAVCSAQPPVSSQGFHLSLLLFLATLLSPSQTLKASLRATPSYSLTPTMCSGPEFPPEAAASGSSARQGRPLP